MLSRQRTTIPVFINERKSDRGFKYVGRQRAQAFRRVAGIIDAAQRRSGPRGSGRCLGASEGGRLLNAPTEYEEASLQGLRRLIENGEAWCKDLVVGVRTASLNRIQILERFREANARKAKLLKWGLGAEVGAVMFVALSVIAVLMSDW